MYFIVYVFPYFKEEVILLYLNFISKKKSLRINFDILYFEALLLLLLILGLFANKHTIHVRTTVESSTGHKINSILFDVIRI